MQTPVVKWIRDYSTVIARLSNTLTTLLKRARLSPSMPNKNYIAGRAFEYRTKKLWERDGYIVLRTAGSHGFADLVAICPYVTQTIYIQCKRVQTKAEAERLAKAFQQNPPLKPRYYTQCIEIYISATRETVRRYA